MGALEVRLLKLERVAPSRVDPDVEVARLRAFLTARLAGIAQRRKGFVPASVLTPEQRAAAIATLHARMREHPAALFPHQSPPDPLKR